MKQIVYRDLLRPLASRLGAVLAGALVALLNVPGGEHAVGELGQALAVVALFAFDLIARKVLP